MIAPKWWGQWRGAARLGTDDTPCGGRIWFEIRERQARRTRAESGGRDSQEQRSRSRKPGAEPGMADPGQSATDLARRLAGGPPGDGRAWWGLGDFVEISGARGGGGRRNGGGGRRQSEAEGEGR